MKSRKSNIIINLVQGLVWAGIFLTPTAVWYLISADIKSLYGIFNATATLFLPSFLIYAVNYYILIPQLLFTWRRKWFFIINALIVLFFIVVPWIRDGFSITIPEEVLAGFPNARFNFILLGSIILRGILYIGMIVLPTGLQYVMRWNVERQTVEEERRRNAEAELNWLKNQLNPHFLFNTLNNISSLTQIDPDKAQESIGQLSELLRYALYESNVQKVKMADEVEFMKNYIGLMALRCSNNTSIQADFDQIRDDILISPLLFVSLIENAFKHGVSTHNSSFVKIDMFMENDDLVFSCENSLVEKNTADYSGSGIGLENMTRRLELLYPDTYSYEQFTEDDRYVAVVRIRNIS